MFLYINVKYDCMPEVMYRCENWSLTLREESRLRVFENMVLRRIFGPKRDEVTREWRKVYNKKLNYPYLSPTIFRVIKSRSEMGGTCSKYGVEERCIQGFGGEPEGQSPFGRPRRRWEDNIKMDLLEVGCGGMDWIDLAQNIGTGGGHL